MKNKNVSVGCFVDGLQSYGESSALVAIDVIRATTTAITAVAMGRRCYVAPNLQSAFEIAARLPNVLLAGELGGAMPDGFEMTNSPATLATRTDIRRPMVLLSSTGTRLMHELRNREASYLACFRNLDATIEHLSENHNAVVLIGAGTGYEFREEDQMCCAWIADGLLDFGFVPEDATTRQLIERWRGVSRDAFMISRSVDYLRRSGQLHDLEFILSHFDDLDTVCKLSADEVVSLAVAAEV